MWASFAEAALKIFTAIFAGFLSWKAGRDGVKKEVLESQVKTAKESAVDRDEIAKLSKAALRMRGSKWVRPNN